MRVQEILQGQFPLTIKCKLVSSGISWPFTCVCGPSNWSLKQSFWHELKAVGNFWDIHWTLGGDFNAVRSRPEEVASLTQGLIGCP